MKNIEKNLLHCAHDGEFDPERNVVVKELVDDIEIASAEVERLNRLSAGKLRKYWWSATRLYPAGSSAGSDAGAG